MKSRPPRPPESSDRRRELSRTKVLAATIELLSKEGFGGVSVDEVSQRSGVAKTTIYRHWPSRAALLLSACSSLGEKPSLPNTGSAASDLKHLVNNMAVSLEKSAWASVLPSILDAAERDPEVNRLYLELVDQFIAPLKLVISNGQKQGELSSDKKPAELAEEIVSSLFFRRWFSRGALSESFTKALLNRVL
jgi:AcrR family transcriptional regulator